MQFVNVPRNARLSSAKGVLRIIGPAGEELTPVEGMDLPAGTLVVLHSEVDESVFINTQLSYSELIVSESLTLEINDLGTDFSAGPPSHQFHEAGTHHFFDHKVTYGDIATEAIHCGRSLLLPTVVMRLSS